MYFVYLLRCADGTLYTGCTNDLDRRLAAHNARKGPNTPTAAGRWSWSTVSRRRTAPPPSGGNGPSSGSPGNRSWS